MGWGGQTTENRLRGDIYKEAIADQTAIYGKKSDTV